MTDHAGRRGTSPERSVTLSSRELSALGSVRVGKHTEARMQLYAPLAKEGRRGSNRP